MSDAATPGFDRAIIDSIPSPLFVVDHDVRIVSFNEAASALLGEKPALALNRKGGEALHCIHSTETLGGCGTAPACASCVIRNAVGDTVRAGTVVRRPQRMQLVGPQGVRDVYLLITTSPFRGAFSRPLAVLLFQDIGELVSSQGIVPVCMHCGKVQEGTRGWTPMASYLSEHLDLGLSHGLCPQCMREHYPEYSDPGSPA